MKIPKITAGAGASPKQGETVHYTGWLMDVTKFDSSVDPRDADYPGAIPNATLIFEVELFSIS